MLLLYLVTSFALFPYPSVTTPVDTAVRHSDIIQLLSPFKVISDTSLYKADLLKKYTDSFSKEAQHYNTSFNKQTSDWSDIYDLSNPVHVKNTIYRLTIMAISYKTTGSVLYNDYSAKTNIINGFSKLSDSYNSTKTYNTNYEIWDIDIPDGLLNLIPVLDSIYTANDGYYLLYKMDLDRIVEALLVLPKRSEFIRKCTGNKDKWYDDVECPMSAIVLELLSAKQMIFASLCTGDVSNMKTYYDRVYKIFIAREWNYDIAPGTDLYDGFREDGSFQEYFSSIIPGASAANMLSFVAAILAPVNKIAEKLQQAGLTADQQSVLYNAEVIRAKIISFILNSILPYAANGYLPDHMSGAQAANDSNPPMGRFARTVVGIMQFAYSMRLGTVSADQNKNLVQIYNYINYHLQHTADLFPTIAGNYNFPIVGSWNESTGIFLASPTYPGQVMRGHYPLPKGDRYAYNAEEFQITIAMNSYHTRNFQCINDLNKLGFFQAAGAIVPVVRSHPDQYKDFIIFASHYGYMGTTTHKSETLKCSLQTHLYGTLSKSKFSSSITDGNHSVIATDNFNVPTNDTHYRTVYLVESLTQGIHVAQMTAGGINIVTLNKTVAVIPYVDGDIVEAYVNGVHVIRTPIHFGTESRILIKVTPKKGNPYAVAVLIRKSLPGCLENISYSNSYQSVGGHSKAKVKTSAILITIQLERSIYVYTDRIAWSARSPVVYSYYPHLPYSTTDTDLVALKNKYNLVFDKGSSYEYAPVGRNQFMTLAWENSTVKVIGLNIFVPSTATLSTGITVKASAAAQILFKQEEDMYTFIVRDPLRTTYTSIELQVSGLTNMKAVTHWCANAGVIAGDILVITARTLGSGLCQVQVSRTASPTPTPIPPVNPPSPTPPPYTPPVPPMADVVYEDTTHEIVTPDANRAVSMRSAIIGSVIVLVLLIVAITCLVVFLLRCRKTARSLKEVNNEIQKVTFPSRPKASLQPLSHWEQSSIKLESAHSMFSNFSEESAMATVDVAPPPAKKTSMARKKVHLGVPTKFGAKPPISKKDEDSDGVANDSFDGIPIQYATSIFK